MENDNNEVKVETVDSSKETKVIDTTLIKKDKKGLLLVLACIVVVVIMATQMTSSKEFGFYTANILSVYDVDKEETRYVYNDKLLSGSLEDSIYRTVTNLDGSVCAVLDYDDKLSVVTKDNIIKVASNPRSFELSATGNVVAYINDKNTLLLYDIASDKTTIIDNDVLNEIVAISPDGGSVAYMVQKDSDTILYVYYKEETHKIGQNLVPIGLSNSAKQIYYLNRKNNGLYVTSLKEDSKKIASDLSSVFIFNENHTQLAFCSDGEWYITENGEDKVKVFEANYYSIDMLLPKHTAVKYSRYSDMIRTYAISSFGDQFYIDYSEDALYYVNKKLEMEEVCTIDECQISKDGSVIYFLDGDSLYKIESSKLDNIVSIADDVDEFVISSDGQSIYYIDEDDTLWYQKGTKDAKRIADDVNDLVMTQDDYALFLTEYYSYSGILYASINGGEKQRVHDDVYSIFGSNTATYYYANYDYDDNTKDLYGTTGKLNFNLIIKEIR